MTAEMAWWTAGRLSTLADERDWHDASRRAADLLAPAWPASGALWEEVHALETLSLLVYGMSVEHGFAEYVPAPDLLERLRDREGLPGFIRDRLEQRGHRIDEADGLGNLFIRLTARRKVGAQPSLDLPSLETPRVGGTAMSWGTGWAVHALELPGRLAAARQQGTT
ncbi:hypothetical protein ACH4PU_01775 [Streptomyces sp. NPDC021100]|uniref:hypothetical protein n=1 Tax=Streptomyces sp. NPDC021100 TaxID=3365114 RepID=UPI0037986826